LLVLCPVSVFAETGSLTIVNNSGSNSDFFLNGEFYTWLRPDRSMTISVPLGQIQSLEFFNDLGNPCACFYNGTLLSLDSVSPTYIGLSYSDTVTVTSVQVTSSPFYISVEAGYTPGPSTPTPTLTPTASPSPTPSPTPSVETFYQPFDSFAGTYYNGQALSFPNSVTRHQYQQYSGIVSDHNMTIKDIRTSVYYNSSDQYMVYRFDYDIQPLVSGDFRFDFLFSSDSDLPSVYVSYILNGQVYECDDFEQTSLTGLYTQYGAFDIDPSQTFGPPFYAWDVDLTSQRSLGVEVEGLIYDSSTTSPITITLYISSSPMPSFGSAFDWAQLFQDTRPDSAFLTTVSSISALPFFLGGLGFLSLGAVIGIVLKFMR